MAKKKKLDKLSLDMIECEKAGYGCHYGAWKATQDSPIVIQKKSTETHENWKVCPHCGNSFKPSKYGGYRQIYCCIECQRTAHRAGNEERYKEYYRTYMRKKRAKEKGVQHG